MEKLRFEFELDECRGYPWKLFSLFVLGSLNIDVKLETVFREMFVQLGQGRIAKAMGLAAEIAYSHSSGKKDQVMYGTRSNGIEFGVRDESLYWVFGMNSPPANPVTKKMTPYMEILRRGGSSYQFGTILAALVYYPLRLPLVGVETFALEDDLSGKKTLAVRVLQQMSSEVVRMVDR